jgi:hypothetical protein
LRETKPGCGGDLSPSLRRLSARILAAAALGVFLQKLIEFRIFSAVIKARVIAFIWGH